MTVRRFVVVASAFAALPAGALAQTDAPLTPPALHWESAAFDPAAQRLVVYGGTGSTGRYVAESWAWDGTRWSVLADSAAGPGARHAHAMTYDARRSRLVMFGGSFETSDTTIPPAQRARRLCDTWSLTNGAWARVTEIPTCPIDGTAGGSLVVAGAGGDLLFVEGRPASADTALVRTRLWRPEGATWALVDSTGPRRPPTASGGAAFDVRRSVLVVPVLAGPDSGVWEWDGARWRHARVAGPPTRRIYGITYDSRRQRVALIGGLTSGPRRPLADHWTWDGSAWTEVPSAGVQPPARSHATLLDDPRHGRLLYFGGAGEGGLQRELWIFDRDGWRRASP